jgi:hypothetical protein
MSGPSFGHHIPLYRGFTVMSVSTRAKIIVAVAIVCAVIGAAGGVAWALRPRPAHPGGGQIGTAVCGVMGSAGPVQGVPATAPDGSSACLTP